MEIQSKDSNNIALVVVGYNRLNSLSNLLNSLNRGDYEGYNVPLVISIDASGDEALYSYVRSFEWKYGNKYVNIEDNRQGLKKHIFKCGDLTRFFKAIVLLEDDLYVSPDFYRFVDCALNAYGNDDRIAQIALYRNEHHGYVGLPIYVVNNGYDVFAKQEATTWGECWNKKMWGRFRTWLESWKEDFGPVDIYYKSKSYERAWGKYFDAYMCINNLFSIVPYISLSTNCGDIGEHSNEGTTDYQVALQLGRRKYEMPPFEALVKYDSYYNYLGLKEYIGVPENELCLDLYGDNPNLNSKRYLLSTAIRPLSIIKTYGLALRPIELNIIYSVRGKGIYLYDTLKTQKQSFSLKEKTALTKYYLRGFSFKRIIELFVFEKSKNISDRIKSMFSKRR